MKTRPINVDLAMRPAVGAFKYMLFMISVIIIVEGILKENIIVMANSLLLREMNSLIQTIKC